MRWGGWCTQHRYCVFTVYIDRHSLRYNAGTSHTFFPFLDQVWLDGWCRRWGSERGEIFDGASSFYKKTVLVKVVISELDGKSGVVIPFDEAFWLFQGVIVPQ